MANEIAAGGMHQEEPAIDRRRTRAVDANVERTGTRSNQLGEWSERLDR
jgi:hypothetical protein